jgi:hypothetical protein
MDPMSSKGLCFNHGFGETISILKPLVSRWFGSPVNRCGPLNVKRRDQTDEGIDYIVASHGRGRSQQLPLFRQPRVRYLQSRLP